MYENNDRPMFDGNIYLGDPDLDLIKIAKDAVSDLFEPKLDHGYIHVIMHQAGNDDEHNSVTYLCTDAPGKFIYQVRTGLHGPNLEAEVVIFKEFDRDVRVLPL